MHTLIIELDPFFSTLLNGATLKQLIQKKTQTTRIQNNLF